MAFNQQEEIVKKYHFFRAPWLGTSNQFRFREKKARVYQHTEPETGVMVDPEMRAEYRNNLENHEAWAGIKPLLADNADSARYVIGYGDGGYFLRDKQNAPQPVFGYHSDIARLIHLVLLVTNWQKELERNNVKTGILRNDIILEFEKLEGIDKNLIVNQDGTSIGSPDSIVLEYKNNFPPALRCKVSSGRKDLYLSAIYLDSSYGITPLANLRLPESGRPKYLSYRLDKTEKTWFSFSLAPFLINAGVNDTTEYLRFIISTGKLNTEVLFQSGFDPEVKGNPLINNLRPEKRIIELGDADWTAFTIPIQIIYRKLSFEEKVLQIDREIQILYPDDPQKGRWGGESSRNGLELRAEIHPGGSSVQANLPAFPLTITVNSLQKGISPAGQIAFFLHNSFARPVIITSFENGQASVQVQAMKAFTVGAYTEDGTRLELDLNNVKGYPPDFYDDLPLPESVR